MGFNLTEATVALQMEGKEQYYDLESLAQRRDQYWDSPLINSEDSWAVRYAKAYAHFLHTKPVVLREIDAFAGLIQHYDMSASMPINYPPDYHPGVLPIYRRENDTGKEVRAVSELLADPEADEYLEILKHGSESGLFAHGPYGHVIPGFSLIVHEGWDGIRQRIDAADIGDGERSDYLHAMHIVVDAATDYTLRWANRAAQLAKETSHPEYRENLENIAEACQNIARHPAKSLFEALQMTLILQELLTTETASGSMSMGRMDQLFYPYYSSDLEFGRITPEAAQHYIDAWRIKLAGLLQGFQNVAICGCDSNGAFAGNDISLMILRSARKYRMDQPLLSLRYTRDMPQAYWEEALQLIELGDGFPALFNDEVIIPSRLAMGVSLEDARNYGIVGCVEPSIGGREFSNTEEMRINWAKVMELMLNNGVCTYNGNRFRLAEHHTLESIRSFEALVEWFKTELKNTIHIAATACNYVDSVLYKRYPYVLLSATMEDCIEQGADVGAKAICYRFSTINNCGMANVVDSLLAIKQAVFEAHVVTLPELKHALDVNFQGFESLQSYLKNRCDKYGNDSLFANQLMAELIDFAAKEINSIPNCRGFRFQTGMYTVDQHASMGICTGAMADGRPAGQSLANAVSPVQGADKAGPTAIINSVTRYDHTQFGNGMVLDLKFSPSMFKNPNHRKMFRALVDTYFSKGGMEVQFNVMSRETLLDAQKHPENYRNLIVRVSGFSAYFTNLYKALQDEIIARTEYADGSGSVNA